MAPGVTSRSSSGSASSDEGFVELYADVSRKRRKLSPSEDDERVKSDDNEKQPSKQAIPALLSRIKSQKTALKPSGPPILEETIINNGKVVDAKSSFASIDVAPWLIASLAAMAIQRPTAIQKGCIPEILAGRDVIGGSRTGSGKTVAFAVPILQKWAEDPVGIFAVVLTPTR